MLSRFALGFVLISALLAGGCSDRQAVEKQVEKTLPYLA